MTDDLFSSSRNLADPFDTTNACQELLNDTINLEANHQQYPTDIHQLSSGCNSEYQCQPISHFGVNKSAPFYAFYQRAQFITGLIFYPIFCFLGLAGNLLTIAVFGTRKMSSSTNIYLTALAVSDSIKLLNDSFYFLVILLLHIDDGLGQQAYGVLYPYAHYLFNLSVCVTSWLTVSVAIERYIMVCHATKARFYCTKMRARAVCTGVFLLIGVITVPFGLR